MVKRDDLETVTVKLEEYAGSIGSYWAREEDYFLSGRFGHGGPNLVMRIPMRMPKRLNGTGFVDVEHWFNFCPFLVHRTSTIPSFCEKTKAIAGKFEVRDYNGRQVNTFEIQSPKRAPHLLIGPINLPHPVEQSTLNRTLRTETLYLHPILCPDEIIVRTCYVVIRFGERIDPFTYDLERSSAQAKHDRTSICQEYYNWLAEELVRPVPEVHQPSSVQLANSHRKTSQKFLRAITDLQSMVEVINKTSTLNHTLTLFPGGVTYDGEIYYDKPTDLEKLTGLIRQQFNNTLRAAENGKEVIRIVKSLDTNDYLAYLHLDFIQSPPFASFILRDSSSSDFLCSYSYGRADTGDYGELLSHSPKELANKIWERFLPIMLAASVRLEQLKALEACDEMYVKKHPRATPTRRIEPTHFL